MAKKKTKKKTKKTRMSLTGLLAFIVAPIATMCFGVPGITRGAFAPGTFPLSKRLFWAMNAFSSAYFAYDFENRKFVPMALLQGYLPVLGHWVIKKTKINRMVGRSVPVLL